MLSAIKNYKRSRAVGGCKNGRSFAQSNTDTTNNDNRSIPVGTSKFQRGDHVYRWCSVAGVPRVYQHHGIVMHVRLIPGTKQDEPEVELTIADFSNFLPDTATSDENDEGYEESVPAKGQRGTPTSSPSSKRPRSKGSFHGRTSGFGVPTGGILRVYTTKSSESEWHKVEYNAPRWKTIVSRSGVSTTVAASDPPEVVLTRVNFLLVQAEREANNIYRSSVLPKYHLIFANCECVATWCKTGNWSTLQGASLLAGATLSSGSGTMACGQAAAATAAAAAAATAPEAAAMASTSGLLGSSVAPLAGTQPWLVPALAAYGAVAVGSCTTILLARAKWKATTERLNEALEQELRRAAPPSPVVVL